MNIKWIGAMLIFLGCGGFGFSMAASYRRTEESLRDLIRSLEYMRCELNYKLTPLPQLCRSASESSAGPVRLLLQNLARELEQQIAPDAKICMDMALDQTPGISESLERLLHSLGQTLGTFDLPGQLHGIDACIASARAEAEIIAREKGNRTRSYQTLGLCAGAALAIILL